PLRGHANRPRSPATRRWPPGPPRGAREPGRLDPPGTPWPPGRGTRRLFLSEDRAWNSPLRAWNRRLLDAQRHLPVPAIRQAQATAHWGGADCRPFARLCKPRAIRFDADESLTTNGGATVQLRAAPGYWQTVPGATNTSRVIALVWVTPLTVYTKVPVLPSVKVKVAEPTAVAATLAGLNGTELKAGPVVRYSVP